ncbi:MAG TPA: molybdate ABC transporter substrate-binding protein [Clostridiales bacterium]|nr:molybdate ABC transporter substrate-binding protein [Clostridiales bacterium]
MMLYVSACGRQNDAAEDNNAKEQEVVSTDAATGNEDVTLLVYCGAGLKKPMTEIAEMFEEENGTKIEYIFAGSTQLLGQIELTGKGDVFIVGSKKAYESAKEKGLAGDEKEVAYHNPIIGVQKGNPLNIETLEDLAEPGVKVVLGDETANAIGETSQRIIEKTGLTGINDNVVSKTATVNELIVYLTSKDADAAIITEDSAFKNEDIDLVPIPEDVNIVQIIPVGALTASENVHDANKFVNFVSSEKGKEIFNKYGFPPVN